MPKNSPDEVVRIAASVGSPAILLIVALSIVGSTGLAGGAALTAALALLGGPGGIPAGIMVLTFVGGVSAALASYGLEALLVAIYNQRINQSEDSDIIETVVSEINSNKLLRDSQKRTIVSAVTKTFSILLVGRTGTGKSSTINSLLGREVAPVGGITPVTSEVTFFDCPINESKIRLYDTPGLCDSAYMANDDDYISAIKEVLPSIDLVLFVTPFNEARVTKDERIALRSLSSAVGMELWENAIVLFSFSCSTLPGDSSFESFFALRTEALREFISEISSPKNSKTLPFLAIDNTSRITPNGCEWIPELFTLIVERCSASGVMPFVEALGDEVGSADDSHEDRYSTVSSTDTDEEVRSRRINLDEEQQQRVKRGVKRSVIGGALIGTLFAASAVPVSVVTPLTVSALFLGAVTGAGMGFLRWLFKR